MKSIYLRIKSNCDRSDTVVFLGNVFAFALFWSNCRIESLAVAYIASLVPLAAQAAMLWRGNKALRQAFAFGAMIAVLWPVGEWSVVNTLGWWGAYTTPDLMILETAVNCSLIGWLASAYLYYLCKRSMDAGFSKAFASMATGVSALILGLVGENFSVASGMWVYETSIWDLWNVPAFVPISYGMAYLTLPWVQRLPVPLATTVFLIIQLVFSVALGLATGFFPRPGF